MAFRPFVSRSSGAWINPVGNVFRDLAKSISALSEDTAKKAYDTAQEHLVGPALRYGAHPSTQAFFQGDNLRVGLPPEHPDAAALADREWGTLTEPAGGHIRRSLRLHGDESLGAFWESLAE